MPRNPVRVAELVGVAILGGALALGGAALFGKLGSHTTIKQVSPLAQGGFNNASLQPAVVKGLTPEQIYRRDAPGVVQITATTVTRTTDPFSFLPQTQTEQSLGSGFVIDKAGHIVTNYHAIRTDAAINHGNSGGPLIDAAGRVIGVTSQISTGNTGQQGNIGIGFAIPINTVRNVAAQIIKTGKAQHPFIGISSTPVTQQL